MPSRPPPRTASSAAMMGALCSLVGWPAAKSTIVGGLASSRVTRLQRNATSSGPSSIPIAAASIGARPVWKRSGSYPRIAMLPTSLPGGRPSGITAARPTSPRAARRANAGIAAASSGVRPSSSASGSSAQPSGTSTTYFNNPPWRRLSTRVGAAHFSSRPDSFTSTMRSARSLPTSFAVIAIFAATALFVAACSGGASGGSSSGSKSTPSSSGAGQARIKLTPVAMIDQPTALAIRARDSTLYVNEQVGRVRAVRDGALDPQPVLDITDEVGSGGERGLLGLAFAPDGGEMYVYYTNRDGDIRLDEYTMSGSTVNAGSRRQVLAVDHPPATNH